LGQLYLRQSDQKFAMSLAPKRVLRSSQEENENGGSESSASSPDVVGKKEDSQFSDDGEGEGEGEGEVEAEEELEEEEEEVKSEEVPGTPSPIKGGESPNPIHVQSEASRNENSPARFTRSKSPLAPPPFNLPESMKPKMPKPV
jgi:hypothetical protein